MDDDVKILQLSYGNYVSLDDYNELKFVYENDVQEIKALVKSMKYREMDFCKLHDEVDRLNNIINELEKWLKGLIENFDEDASEPILHEQMTINLVYDYLENLKELKESKQ